MTSPPLDNTHGRPTSGMACHHRLWAAHIVKRRQAWHDITAFGQHTQWNDVERDMSSPPLESTHGRTMSCVAFHHCLKAAQMVKRRQALHAITAFGLHTRSNVFGHGMPSSPLGSTHGRTTSGVACHHRLWAAHTIERGRACHAIIALGRQTPSNDVRCGMPSSPLGSTNSRTASGVACHHSP